MRGSWRASGGAPPSDSIHFCFRNVNSLLHHDLPRAGSAWLGWSWKTLAQLHWAGGPGLLAVDAGELETFGRCASL